MAVLSLFQRLQRQRQQHNPDRQGPRTTAGPVALTQGLGGQEIRVNRGTYYLVQSRQPGELPWPRGEALTLPRELQLVRGVGPVTARYLRQNGAARLEDLRGHPRWEQEAAACLELLSTRDVESLRRRGATDAQIMDCFAPEDAAILDIETTGLWFGQPLFLVGVLHWDGESLQLQQFLARHFSEEAALLEGLLQWLQGFSLLLTFNGRKFDLPYIQARAAAHGLRPVPRHPQVDLLYPARRRYRGRLPNCRLTTLEEHLLGQEREDDVPGHLIPELYHRFARTQDPRLMEGILRHNALDLVSLARLLPWLVASSPDQGRSHRGRELPTVPDPLDLEERNDEEEGEETGVQRRREAVSRPSILVINPGSTSTKLALFSGPECQWEVNLSHGSGELATFHSIIEQYPLRRRVIRDYLDKQGVEISSLAAVVGRGGLLRPIPGGTYRVSPPMLEELQEARRGEHASNLGAVLADEIAREAGCPAFIVDPVVVDELEPLARITGMPEIERHSIFHALNQKAVARKAAAELGRPYEQVSLVVAHLGGGISVGAHSHGRIVDVNNALDGDGPFSPERSGGLPVGGVMRLCFSGEYTQQELRKKVVGGGGIVAYLGTNDAREVEQRIDQGDQEALRVYQALAYQVSKDVAAAGAVLKGKVDAVVITGGLANSQRLVDWIKERVAFVGPVLVLPGEEEMEALALGALRVLNGEEEAREYPPRDA